MYMFEFDPLKIVPYHNGFPGHRTSIGGALKLLSVLIGIALCYLFGQELWEKKKPFMLMSEKFDSTAVLSRKELNIAFRIISLDASSTQVDISKGTSFTAKNTMISRKLQKKVDSKAVNVINCRTDSFYSSANASEFIFDDISSYNCLSDLTTDNQNITISGSYGGNEFKTVNIGLAYCDSSNSNCQSRQEVNKLLDSLYLHVVSTSVYVDSSNLSLPVQFTFNSKLIKLIPDNSKKYMLYYKGFDFYSDEGILSEVDLLTKTGFYFARDTLDSFYDPKTLNLIDFTITLDKSRVIYSRSYTRLQSVAANIFGLLKIILFILEFIGNKYSYADFYNTIYAKYDIAALPPRRTAINKDIKLVDHSNISGNNSSSRKEEIQELPRKNLEIAQSLAPTQPRNMTCSNFCAFHCKLKCMINPKVQSLINTQFYFEHIYSVENIFTTLENSQIMNKVIFGDSYQVIREMIRQNTLKKINDRGRPEDVNKELSSKLKLVFQNEIQAINM